MIRDGEERKIGEICRGYQFLCLQSTIGWARHLELEPSNLVFEVVESYKVSDLEHLKNVLDYYRANGFLVALDDVGSGYSSLNMLVSLKPDIVKIDKEMVRREIGSRF